MSASNIVMCISSGWWEAQSTDLLSGLTGERKSEAVESGEVIIAKSTEAYSERVRFDVPCGKYDPEVPGKS